MAERIPEIEKIRPTVPTLPERIGVADAERLSILKGPRFKSLFLPGVFPESTSGAHASPAILPNINYASFTPDRLAWYEMSFSRAYSETPTVVANIEFRPGWVNRLEINPSTNADRCRGNVHGACMEALRGWGWWPASIVRDAVCWLAGVAGWFVGYISALTANWALNEAIPLLHSYSGRPAMKLTTAEVWNVTTSSLRVLGYPRARVHLFVIGR